MCRGRAAPGRPTEEGRQPSATAPFCFLQMYFKFTFNQLFIYFCIVLFMYFLYTFRILSLQLDFSIYFSRTFYLYFLQKTRMHLFSRKHGEKLVREVSTFASASAALRATTSLTQGTFLRSHVAMTCLISNGSVMASDETSFSQFKRRPSIDDKGC